MFEIGSTALSVCNLRRDGVSPYKEVYSVEFRPLNLMIEGSESDQHCSSTLLY